MPQVPAVPALHRVRQRRADSLAVGPRPVTGDNLDAGVPAEPVFDDVGGASFEDIDAPAGLGVDEDRRVDEAPAQGEIIPSTRGTAREAKGILRRTRSAVCRETPMPSIGSSRAEARPANSRATALTWAVSREMRRW